MKILVIFTGGTIGSSLSDGWIAPDDKSKYLLINKFREKSDEQIDFDFIEPYTLLSENLSANELNMLVSCVKSNLNKNYDGIIVTHGTDTLQYSAAAVAFSVDAQNDTVVFVSSNYPLADSRANGLDNFIAAVEFIKSKCGTGVFISYKNKSDMCSIHNAIYVSSHSEQSDEINSLGNEPIAFFDGNSVIKNEKYISQDASKIIFDNAFTLESEILVVSSVPGTSFCRDLSGYKALMLIPYHSGTLNTSDLSFRRLCYDAKEKNIPVFLCDAPTGNTYESAKIYDELSICRLSGMPFPSSYIKLWLCKDEPDVKKIMMCK